MALLQRLLPALLALSALGLLRLLVRRSSLPDFPLGLPLLALASWTLMPSIEALGLPAD